MIVLSIPEHEEHLHLTLLCLDCQRGCCQMWCRLMNHWGSTCVTTFALPHQHTTQITASITLNPLTSVKYQWSGWNQLMIIHETSVHLPLVWQKLYPVHMLPSNSHSTPGLNWQSTLCMVCTAYNLSCPRPRGQEWEGILTMHLENSSKVCILNWIKFFWDRSSWKESKLLAIHCSTNSILVI